MGSLRRQSLLLTALTLIVFMVIGIAISRHWIERSMREFETRDAGRSLQQVNQALQSHMLNLRKQARDYAVWNATYDFMQNHDSTYIGENYSSEIFSNIDSDYLIILRTDGTPKVLLQHIPDTGSDRLQRLAAPDALCTEVIKQLASYSSSDKPQFSGSVLWFNKKPYQYGFSSILNNQGAGPARGLLVYVRELSPARLHVLTEMTEEAFLLRPPQSKLLQSKTHIEGEQIVSTGIFRDTDKRVVAEIEIRKERPLKSQINTVKNIININSLMLTLLALASVYYLFDRVVLQKIEKLVQSISNIRTQQGGNARVALQANSDIDRISTEVNNLLDNLAGSHAQLQYEALHDHLTGLGNRKLFLQQLERACSDCRTGTQNAFYVYLLDLDAFKDINDLYGHLAGDHVIKTIAGRLAHSASYIDLPIRIGGDEFALIARPKQAFDPEHFAAHLLELITLPMIWENYTLAVCASIGIVAVDSTQKAADKPIELLRKADIAMYASKNTTKNGYRLFHEDIDKQLSERKRLEAELDSMIAQETSEIWLQPVLNQHNGRLYAVEILSRWFHSDMGEIYPDVFIGLAEESKRIVKFDQSVIRRACQLFSELQLLQSNIRLSVNISATTLMEPFISEFIAGVLKTYALPEDALMLEITETALATRENALIDSIQAIRKLGVTFLIDDFGTGYSSLSRLHTLPLDFVKIDRRFLQTLDSEENSICNAIIRLAHSLDMQVIAEGVETQIQHERLLALDCDYAQGFHYARPMPHKEFHAYMARNNFIS